MYLNLVTITKSHAHLIKPKKMHAVTSFYIVNKLGLCLRYCEI